MALNVKSIDKKFLNEFMLQAASAFSRGKEKERAKALPEKMPFIRPFIGQPKPARLPLPQTIPKPQLIPKQVVNLPLPQAKPTLALVKTEIAEQPQIEAEKTKEIIEAKEEIKKEIEFGKLDDYIRNPLIFYIECPGENQAIKIRKKGDYSSLETNIILTKTEIECVIKAFAEKSGTEIKNIFKASAEGLTMNAITSEFFGARFVIIKKTF